MMVMTMMTGGAASDDDNTDGAINWLELNIVE